MSRPEPYEPILELIDAETSALARDVLTGTGYPEFLRAELDKLRSRLASALNPEVPR